MKEEKQAMIHGVRVSTALASGRRRAIALVCLALAAVIASQAQHEQASPETLTFKTLVKFDVTNGNSPGPVAQPSGVQGTDGNFYGTTSAGGNFGGGTVFRITSGGPLTTLYNFCSVTNCADGNAPTGLVLGADGNFYGTTQYGGTFGGGTIFKITSTGTLTPLYDFCALLTCADGSNPTGLVLGADGNFYGTTRDGGIGPPFCVWANGCGTIFRINPEGAENTLYGFCELSNCSAGSQPAATLIQATDGNLYGTTQYGGTFGGGTVFKLTPAGPRAIYVFCALANCADGSTPQGPLVQSSLDGALYGTTADGGIYGTDTQGGTVFKITLAGDLTTLYSFCQGTQSNCTDGIGVSGGLVEASDGNFYGATAGGGTNSGCVYYPTCGTVFKITRSGVLTTLHDFNGSDGEAMLAGLVQKTSGVLYGTPWAGGIGNSACLFGCGTLFSLSAGLPPFVEILPTAARVGAVVKILGNNLTTATALSFNGTAAAFKLISSTEIETRVPSGATTGLVTVTTSTITLKSNTRFSVRP